MIYPPRTPGPPRCSRSLHFPGLCFALTHQQVAKLASLEKSFFKRDPADRHLFAAEGSWREEFASCSFQPSAPPFSRCEESPLLGTGGRSAGVKEALS